MYRDDILFIGQGSGLISVECLTGMFRALEEANMIPGQIRASSGSALFTSLYYSAKQEEIGSKSKWFDDLMTNNKVTDFIHLRPYQAIKTLIGRSNYIFNNDNVYDLLLKNMTADATKRIEVSVTRTSDYETRMVRATPAFTLAATSIPYVFMPVHIGDAYYQDGGVFNNIPMIPISECPNWKHIFVFLAPKVDYSQVGFISSILNTLSAVMDREVEQIEEAGYFKIPNITFIQPPSSLSAWLLGWSNKFELRDAVYNQTKEILKNVNLN